MSGEPSSGRGDPGVDAGAAFGPYRLLEKLGEGGMGEVWAAEQSAPVRRRVAIKIVKAGMDTKQVIARFEAERQALALMDHPAIAKVFDAGETPRGLPFFAMEHVSGEPLTAWCDRERMANEERLRLFLEVCHGVQHAHQKGVIHRDLKPANVLVTIQDGRPVPKIIDFGLAKAIEQRLTERTLLTEHGALIGTPEYMSPEQVSGLGVDTRTDIYALGVILYELLTGVLPHDVAALRSAGFDELRRRIREVDPPTPSRRVESKDGDSSECAARRRTAAARLARELRGELDWIVMKALEKDPARRYASPSELAADVERYLFHEPVSARAPSAAYRARKFVRRHRIGVAVASLALLGLAAFAGTTAVQAARIATERDRAERVSEFLTGLFRDMNPVVAQGRSFSARELLDLGRRRLEGLDEHPLVRADLMRTMGSAYRVQGLAAEAAQLLEKATELRERELGASHLHTLEARTELGTALWAIGEHAKAEAALRRALEDGALDDDALAVVAMHNLGDVLRDRGDLDGGEKWLRDALERAQRALGPEHPTTLGVLMDLSGLVAEHSPAQAVPLVRELVPRLRAAVGEDDPLTIVALANLASYLRASGEIDEAVAVGEDALERAQRVLGESAEATLNTLVVLAKAYTAQGRHDEAVELATVMDETVARTRGRGEPFARLGKHTLGHCCMKARLYADAERARVELLALERAAFGEDEPALANTMYDLACSLARQDKRAEAVEMLRLSVEQGYRDGKWMTQDPDLASLHGDEGFEALVVSLLDGSAGPR